MTGHPQHRPQGEAERGAGTRGRAGPPAAADLGGWPQEDLACSVCLGRPGSPLLPPEPLAESLSEFLKWSPKTELFSCLLVAAGMDFPYLGQLPVLSARRA